MARRPGERTVVVPPRARRIAGWVAAVALVGGIALGVRLIGGSGDGSPADAAPSGPSTEAAPITFGTLLDPATGLVANAAQTVRFAEGDSFAYSVAGVPPGASVNVEVERVSGGALEIVQPSSPQSLGPGAAAIAFTVPADRLIEAFGPGEYRMRIYFPGASKPAAEGTFGLVATVPSAAP
ncbi:MAG: hypothetical protein ACR2F5_04485 [Candidatus Limnocylindria bacterium]